VAVDAGAVRKVFFFVTAQVGGADKASSRKAFFFEKKKQKTLAQLASAFPQRLSLNF
jgi:hypothetical protein